MVQPGLICQPEEMPRLHACSGEEALSVITKSSEAALFPLLKLAPSRRPLFWDLGKIRLVMQSATPGYISLTKHAFRPEPVQALNV